MNARRLWLPLTLLVAGLGCREAAAPSAGGAGSVPVFGTVAPDPSHVLQQGVTAPALETHQVSFWAYKGTKESGVIVRYQPAAGETVGRPFLQFDTPKDALASGANGAFLRRGDSVRITLNIDRQNFAVDFQPSGVVFKPTSPARLTVWYGNADLDLNDNGQVDGWDWTQLSQLAFWYMAGDRGSYKMSSRNNTSQLLLSTLVEHFSAYAVSW